MKYLTFALCISCASAGFAATTQPSSRPTTKPWIGLTVVDYTSSDNPKTAARVDSVEPNSPAAKLQINDLITLWDAKAVHSKADFEHDVDDSVIGTTYVVGYLRKDPTRYKFFSEKIVVSAEMVRKKKIPDIVLAVGSVGMVGQVHVQQVIDAHNMIATVYQEHEEWVGPSRPVFNFSSIRKRTVEESPVVWFTNVDTAGLVDGAAKSLFSVFEVTGTKTYATPAGGSKTVFVLSPKEPSSSEPPVSEQPAVRQPGAN